MAGLGRRPPVLTLAITWGWKYRLVVTRATQRMPDNLAHGVGMLRIEMDSVDSQKYFWNSARATREAVELRNNIRAPRNNSAESTLH